MILLKITLTTPNWVLIQNSLLELHLNLIIGVLFAYMSSRKFMATSIIDSKLTASDQKWRY